MAKFNSILVANRGEIALRILTSAKAQGYRTIVIYSEADASAPFVKFADEAMCIGAAPVAESYLDSAKVLAAAKQTGAGAIHPGYGFLSENADFAKACVDAGLVFIGPSPEAIALMGNKAAAKRKMIKAGVVCVPGYEGDEQTDSAFVREADKIGFPIMVKAAAGGGGRGMRLVMDNKDLVDALQSARSEAKNAFGSDELILEKAVMRPRHVEVQIFADQSGNTVHFGERDCSVQRRHQKVIEESPCPVLTEELRVQMGAAAVEAARSINYVGAGTVEFLLGEDDLFYFLEMNTRLQVEHPVTEMVTGVDLVALQIKVAQGEDIGLEQSDISLSGHAIEARLYAEDVSQDFLPMTGKVSLWNPSDGEGIRNDAGIETGSEISPFYDPMIAKVIAWGETRDIAINRLSRALKETQLFGVTTNKGFIVDILNKETFINGEATTAFIAENFTEKQLSEGYQSSTSVVIAAVLDYENSAQSTRAKSLGISDELINWSTQGKLTSYYKYGSDEDAVSLTVSTRTSGAYEVCIGEDILEVTVLERQPNRAKLVVGQQRVSVSYQLSAPGCIDIDLDGHVLSFRNEFSVAKQAAGEAGGGRVIAPMHGTLIEVSVKLGDHVKKDDKLAVLEAMKMQHDILAQVSGVIVELEGEQGAQISKDDLILLIEPEESEDKKA